MKNKISDWLIKLDQSPTMEIGRSVTLLHVSWNHLCLLTPTSLQISRPWAEYILCPGRCMKQELFCSNLPDQFRHSFLLWGVKQKDRCVYFMVKTEMLRGRETVPPDNCQVRVLCIALKIHWDNKLTYGAKNFWVLTLNSQARSLPS